MRFLSAAAVVVLLVSLSLTQASYGAVAQPAALSPAAPLHDLLSLLSHPAWRTRAAALTALRRREGWVEAPDARAAVVMLLGMENAARARSVATGRGPAKDFGEEYNAYYGEILLPTIVRVVDVAPTPEALAAAAGSSFNPESEFAHTLSRTGDEIVPVAARLATDEMPWRRENGLALLGLAIRSSRERTARTPVSPPTMDQAMATLLTAVQDPNPAIRRAAVRALADGGDERALPILTQMAQSDPDTKLPAARIDLSVRGEAQRALEQVRARTGRR